MTSQKAKDIVKAARGIRNPLCDSFIVFIGNILGAYKDADKTLTKEDLKITLNGFAISVILSHMYQLDLEVETDTFLTDDFVNDVTDVIWDTWLKEQIEKIDGDNVVPLKAIN